jgi:hypothetical protein
MAVSHSTSQGRSRRPLRASVTSTEVCRTDVASISDSATYTVQQRSWLVGFHALKIRDAGSVCVIRACEFRPVIWPMNQPTPDRSSCSIAWSRPETFVRTFFSH